MAICWHEINTRHARSRQEFPTYNNSTATSFGSMPNPRSTTGTRWQQLGGITIPQRCRKKLAHIAVQSKSHACGGGRIRTTSSHTQETGIPTRGNNIHTCRMQHNHEPHPNSRTPSSRNNQDIPKSNSPQTLAMGRFEHPKSIHRTNNQACTHNAEIRRKFDGYDWSSSPSDV